VDNSSNLSSNSEKLDQILASRGQLLDQIHRVIVGQHDVVEQIMTSLFAGGHCLITGAPGLAKTLLVKSIGDLFDLEFQRIQFTPDLMPADITGTEVLEEGPEGRRLKFVPGPVFANIVLADEINRTPPKTQAALLEAMQEKQVSAGGATHALPLPFFVLATQNPVEMEGTYPLPEAQLDRFFFNVVMDYLPEDEEVEVIRQTTGAGLPQIQPMFTGDQLMEIQQVVRQVPVSEDLIRYAVKLASGSRPTSEVAPDFVQEMVGWGAGTRAPQCLILGAKARALLQGRVHVTRDDIHALAKPVLRHRILLNYRAEAEGITVESIIDRLLGEVTVPA
jgi:MoxR-like ATPase